MSEPASHPITTVQILPITFEPFDGQSDKYSGAIPPAIEPERGMVEAGVLHNQIRGNQSRPPTTSDQITTSRLESFASERCLSTGAIRPELRGRSRAITDKSRRIKSCVCPRPRVTSRSR